MGFDKFDLSEVKFSRNDKKFGIKIPETLTKELAYEIGVHIGDGYLGIFKRPDGWSYLNVFSGNYREEIDFYENVVCPIIFRLYNKKVRVKKSTKNTLQVAFKSKAISTFKHHVLGLPCGRKKGVISIPSVIMNSELKKHCLQGIVDTDFSLSFRHGKYPRIGGAMPIENEKLKNQIMKIFRELKIGAICSVQNRRDFRYSPIKEYKQYRIDVNGKDNLKRWLDMVGFKSSKHITKLKLWKATGFCKPMSNIQERESLLPR